MKKLHTLLVAALFCSVAFTSCSKDDDKKTTTATPVTKENLIGKWEFDKYQLTVNGVASPEQNYPNQAGCSNDYFVLDGSGSYYGGNFTPECNVNSYNGSWTLSDKTISTIVNNAPDSLVVEDLTATTLAVKHLYYSGGAPYIQRYKLKRVLLQS
jgi:hypothetical protein